MRKFANNFLKWLASGWRRPCGKGGGHAGRKESESNSSFPQRNEAKAVTTGWIDQGTSFVAGRAVELGERMAGKGYSSISAWPHEPHQRPLDTQPAPFQLSGGKRRHGPRGSLRNTSAITAGHDAEFDVPLLMIRPPTSVRVEQSASGRAAVSANEGHQTRPLSERRNLCHCSHSAPTTPTHHLIA